MLKDSIPQVEEMTFRKELEAELYTKKTKYISKQQATEKLMKDLGEDFVSFFRVQPSSSLNRCKIECRLRKY